MMLQQQHKQTKKVQTECLNTKEVGAGEKSFKDSLTIITVPIMVHKKTVIDIESAVNA